MWKTTSESQPPKEAVVVVIERGRPRYAMHFGDLREWYECEKDGGMVFTRDGSPHCIGAPEWWCELPNPERS